MAKQNDVFLIKNNELSNKYNPIWHKVSTVIKEKFDSGPVGNKNFLKIKIKSYSDEAKNIHDQEMPKEGSNRAYLAVRSLDSVLKKDENYYSQLFLKECKCKEKSDYTFYRCFLREKFWKRFFLREREQFLKCLFFERENLKLYF